MMVSIFRMSFVWVCLNESPSEKEGKSVTRTFNQQMMVLPQ